MPSSLAEERAAVLDAYFHDLRVETVSEGVGWSKMSLSASPIARI